MKLLGSTKSKINKTENGKSFLNFEITGLVLVLCNIGNNNYQENSRVLYTFVSNKSFGQLIDISSQSFIFLKTFGSECLYNEL